MENTSNKNADFFRIMPCIGTSTEEHSKLMEDELVRIVACVAKTEEKIAESLKEFLKSDPTGFLATSDLAVKRMELRKMMTGVMSQLAENQGKLADILMQLLEMNSK